MPHPAEPVEIHTDALPIVERVDGTYRLTFEDACASVDLTPRQLQTLIRRAIAATRTDAAAEFADERTERTHE